MIQKHPNYCAIILSNPITCILKYCTGIGSLLSNKYNDYIFTFKYHYLYCVMFYQL